MNNQIDNNSYKNIYQSTIFRIWYVEVTSMRRKKRFTYRSILSCVTCLFFDR